MVLIIFGLVVPMSVLTQLLTATLWKAFCFLNEIPMLMLPVVNSHKLRMALRGIRNKSWTSAFSFFFFFSFLLFIPSLITRYTQTFCFCHHPYAVCDQLLSDSQVLILCSIVLLGHILLASGNQDGTFCPVREMGQAVG